MDRMRGVAVGLIGFLAGGLTVGATLGVRAAGAASGKFWKEAAPPVLTREKPASPEAPAESLPSLRGLVKTVSPTVVFVFTTKNVHVQQMNPHQFPFNFGPFGFRFGPDQDPNQEQGEGQGQGDGDQGMGGGGEYQQHALGSGFVLSSDGYILTNNHVVAGVDEIKVKLADGREFTAKVIGRDPQFDIGLVKIEAKDLPAVTLGDSDQAQPGDWVMAMGNPLGFDHSVSLGIVSGLAREIGIGRYDSLLQTDAAINPGNSGGPLFNLRGEVVGINTAIIGGANNIGFAIPINMAKEILPDLREHGKPIRGQLGVLLKEISPDEKDALGLPSTEGSLIQKVLPGKPADKAGLKPGDVIVSFQGQPVRSRKELQRMVARTHPGTEVSIGYIREGKKKESTARLIEFEEEGTVASTGGEQHEDGGGEKLGVTVSNLTPDLAERYGLREAQGVVIRRVERSSPAEEAGLEPGEVIREVNHRRVSSVEDFKAELGKGSGKPVLLLVEKNGETEFLVVSPRRSSSR